MTTRALNPYAPEWFTPDGDDDEGQTPARFKIRGLTGSQQAEVMPDVEILADDNAKILPRAMYLLLKHGLLDWEGLENDAGPVRFGKNMKTNQDYLSYPIQVELAGRIFELTFNTDDDKKK